MPRDKSKKFLKQKYAQQHKKTAARKHEDTDDIGLPAPIHHLDDAVSKKRNKKNKYASKSHKDERIKDGSDDDNNDNNGNNDDLWNNSTYTPLAIGTSTEEIIQSFERDMNSNGHNNDNDNDGVGGGGSHNDFYNTGDLLKKRGGRHKSMHSLSSLYGASSSALRPVDETESIDDMSTAATTTGAGGGGGDDNNEVLSENGSASVSEMTSHSEVMQEPLEQATAIHDMDTCLEFLGNKDSIERIDALEKIVHLLTRRFFDDFFAANMDKLPKCAEALVQCLKKGDAAEQCLALQVIELIVTTVQSDMGLFVQEIRPVLVKLILEAMNTRVQSMAISAFTYLVWLSDNTSHVQSTLQFLEKLWKAPMKNEAKTSAVVASSSSKATEEEEEEKVQASNESHSNNQQEEDRAERNEETGDNEENGDDEENDDENGDDEEEKHFKEEEEREQKNELFSNMQFNKLLNANAKSKAVALQNWTWLISGLAVGGIASLLDTYESELSPLLQANELALRCASGEALTLLITNYKDAVANQDVVEEFDLQPVEWNNVMESFITLRDGSDKKRKANEVRRQRREFREFISSITENWKPEVAIKLQNASVELKGWNECISYHRVKDIMGGGLQLHLMENEKLRMRLQIEADEFAPQSQNKDAKEKKQKTFKRSSRLQKESRKKQRHSKNAFRFEPTDEAPAKKK